MKVTWVEFIIIDITLLRRGYGNFLGIAGSRLLQNTLQMELLLNGVHLLADCYGIAGATSSSTCTFDRQHPYHVRQHVISESEIGGNLAHLFLGVFDTG